MTQYDNAFYDQITEGSLRSARKVLPHFFDVFYKPKSVIDFGCGTGAWLSVFMELGVDDVLGLDGNYVDINRLLIPKDKFMPVDLESDRVPDKRVDLAISLEVAEHLSESRADKFVANLCYASDLILFSAAVPGQNGVGHINEQWPSYWVPKFQANGYDCSSNFRFDFWNDEDIENWYRQNILVFAKEPTDVMQQFYYQGYHYFAEPQVLDVIHYNNWMHKI